MAQHVFSIRRSFLLPLGLIVLLTLILLISCLLLQVPLAKTLILAAFMIPAILLFAESCLRRVYIEEDGIQINKLFRNKRISYAEMTEIDTVVVRKRAFVSLSSETDFIVLSNSYDHFDQLLTELLARAPATVISEETKKLASQPPKKSSDMFSAWLAVVVLVVIIYVQIKGAF
ncbi:MAG: hypothetical protein BA864_15860 [Desulfuromonadales bacterium C00003093]|nr:MAG: hypothetical protein BA864_15860 [Desulfuromonadales bacterium C00003093]